MDRCVVMAGNITEGYDIIGPFDTFDDASKWADKYVDGFSWIATLWSPKDHGIDNNDVPLDGDAESALASAGFGTDEDYGS